MQEYSALINDPPDELKRSLISVFMDMGTEWASVQTSSRVIEECLHRLVTGGVVQLKTSVKLSVLDSDFKVQREEQFIVAVCGVEWRHNTLVRTAADVGLLVDGKITERVRPDIGRHICEFRLTAAGELLQLEIRSTGRAYDLILRAFYRQNDFPFEYQLLHHRTVFPNQGAPTSSATAVAASMAVASVGDITNHIHNHVAAPVVNVQIQIPQQPPAVVNASIPSGSTEPIDGVSKRTSKLSTDAVASVPQTMDENTAAENRAFILKAILLSRHFDDDGKQNSLEPLSLDVVLEQIKQAHKGKPLPPGVNRSGVSRMFGAVFGKKGHAKYATLVRSGSDALYKLIKDIEHGYLPTLNSSSSSISDD